MTETTPRALLLDLGKVLVDYDWAATLSQLAEPIQDVTAEDLDAWAQEPDGPVERYATGRAGTAEFLSQFHERFDPLRSIDDGWIVHRWCDMFVAMPGSFELVDSLRGRLKLALISNTNPMHFAWLENQHQLRRRFDEVFLSHESGSLKPDPTMYSAALDACGVSASEAYFVDDLAENVEAAASLGIRGCVFEGIEALRDRLREMGLA